MESRVKESSTNLQAPPDVCADTLVYKVMGRSVEVLIDNTVRTGDKAEVTAPSLPNTKFIVKCGLAGCAGQRVLSLIGSENRLFYAPSHPAASLGICTNTTIDLSPLQS